MRWPVASGPSDPPAGPARLHRPELAPGLRVAADVVRLLARAEGAPGAAVLTMAAAILADMAALQSAGGSRDGLS